MGYVLGVDGGGSKTLCLAAETGGKLLGMGRGGPANTNYVRRQVAAQSLVDAIQGALEQAGLQGAQIDCLCISAPAEPEAIAEALRACKIQHMVRAAEGETPRWAMRFWSDLPLRVTVDAGTGSLARAWAQDGRVASAGGWGGTLGDEGSGYWISIQAMRAVLQAHDGRIPATRLTQAVFAHFGMSDAFDLVFRATQGLVQPDLERRYAVAPDSGSEHGRDKEKETGGLVFQEIKQVKPLSRDEIASLCPVVVQVAQEGDEKARQILADAGEELGNLALAVIRRLGMEEEAFALAPFGGVFKAGELVTGSLRQSVLCVAERVRVVTPRYEPVHGAVLLALNELGIPITSEVLSALKNSTVSV